MNNKKYATLEQKIVDQMPPDIFALYKNREFISIQEKALITNFLITIYPKMPLELIALIFGTSPKTLSDEFTINNIKKPQGEEIGTYIIPSFNEKIEKEKSSSISSDSNQIKNNENIELIEQIEKIFDSKLEIIDSRFYSKFKIIASKLEIMNKTIDLIEEKIDLIEEKNKLIQRKIDNLQLNTEEKKELDCEQFELTYEEVLPDLGFLQRSYLIHFTMASLLSEFCKIEGLKQKDCITQFVFEGLQKYSSLMTNEDEDE